MKKIHKQGLGGILMLVLFIAGWQGCTPTDYEQMVAREKAKGIRADSLFMGIYLGMSQQDFYTHCWDLNKQGLIRQGTRNTTVRYEMTELKAPASMDFYPSFYEEKIDEMPVTFSYYNWAPWNKELGAKVLQQDLVALFEKWYGSGFIKVEHPEKGLAFVKVDGNRRINIIQKNDFEVVALFTDLWVERETEIP